MNAQTEYSASSGANDFHSDQSPPLDREDQAALELGFAPGGGLSWRRRRVHQLRESIDCGSYEVDPYRVAEALLARLGATP